MTNNPLPAALASIKRYGPDDAQFYYAKDIEPLFKSITDGEIPSADTLRLHLGEMTSQEMRTAKAACRFMLTASAPAVISPHTTMKAKFATLPPPADGKQYWALNELQETQKELGAWKQRALQAEATPPADSAMVEGLWAFIYAIKEVAARDAYDADRSVVEWTSFVPRHLVAPLERARTLLAGRK